MSNTTQIRVAQMQATFETMRRHVLSRPARDTRPTVDALRDRVRPQGATQQEMTEVLSELADRRIDSVVSMALLRRFHGLQATQRHLAEVLA